MTLSSTFLSPFVLSVTVNPYTKITSGKSFRVNCSIKIERTATKPAAVETDGVYVQEKSGKLVKEPSMSTKLTSYHVGWDPFKATSTPIYQTATFKIESATKLGEYSYTRNANPTRDTFEKILVKLDKAEHVYCFSSGMSVLTAVCKFVNPGNEIITVEDIYGVHITSLTI